MAFPGYLRHLVNHIAQCYGFSHHKAQLKRWVSFPLPFTSIPLPRPSTSPPFVCNAWEYLATCHQLVLPETFGSGYDYGVIEEQRSFLKDLCRCYLPFDRRSYKLGTISSLSQQRSLSSRSSSRQVLLRRVGPGS